MLDGRLPGTGGGAAASGVGARISRPKRERVGLGARIGAQVGVQPEVDEIGRHHLRALVQELVERVLAHGASAPHSTGAVA